MSQEEVKARGAFTLTLLGPDGAVKQEAHVDNLIVTTGLAWMAGRFGSSPPTAMSHIAVGTTNTAPVVGNTALAAEAARAALTSTTVTANKVTYQTTFGPGVGTGALVESGVFNAASAGTMLNRGVFPVINKGANDTLVVTWDITQS